jgi:hypothetical protein
MFHLWRRVDEEGRQRVWRLYGWYSGLMMCGSCFGAVSWAARMMSLAYGFKANQLLSIRNNAEGTSFWALSCFWRPTFTVMYAIEFLCLSVAKLMVLDRISDLATPDDGMQKWWAAGGRIVVAIVVLGNVVGFAANVAVAVHYQKAGDAYSTASAFYAANNTQDGHEYNSLAQAELQLAGSIAFVQSLSEAAVLLLIVAAFAVAAFICIRRISSALSILDSAGIEMAAQLQMRQQAVGLAMAVGRQLRQKIFLTTGFVFVAFVLRSVFATMYTVAYQLRDIGNACPEATSSCDASCYNVYTPPNPQLLNRFPASFNCIRYTHVSRWMFFTPQFQLIVVLISSPLALLVALWGATSNVILKFRARASPSCHPPAELNGESGAKCDASLLSLH